MPSPSNALNTVPPQAVVMQMVMGGWVARVISDVSRLNIPDMLKKQGSMSAAELAARGVDANVDALERVMRACSSLGVFAEDGQGRFGLTPLSEVLTSDSPASVKAVAQEMGGLWLRAAYCWTSPI